MALVKYGGGLVQMSGSIAGTTFARNASGNFARARTKPVNPSSALQVTRRTALAYLTEYWHETITSAQRTAWATYANAVPMKNRLGESIKISGFNHFCRSNSVRLMMGLTLTPEGPPTLTLPEIDPTFAIAGSVATQLLSITYDITLPWHSVVGSGIAIVMGRPQVSTRNFFKGPYNYAGKIIIADTSPKTIAAPFTLVLGQKIWCYARISGGALDSRCSNRFSDDAIVAA
jgi:hypothetical protein